MNVLINMLEKLFNLFKGNKDKARYQAMRKRGILKDFVLTSENVDDAIVTLKARQLGSPTALTAYTRNSIHGTVEELIMALGYEPVESKNQYMRSYRNEAGFRINYYFTTETVTVQPPRFIAGMAKTETLKEATVDNLEDFIDAAVAKYRPEDSIPEKL